MLQLTCRFLENQTFFRLSRDDTRVGQQSSMIGIEIESEQRQPKPTLALKRSMALCRIAAQPAQQRNNVPLKIWRAARIVANLVLFLGSCLGREGQGRHDERQNE